jgi:hypothetical protein
MVELRSVTSVVERGHFALRHHDFLACRHHCVACRSHAAASLGAVLTDSALFLWPRPRVSSTSSLPGLLEGLR